MRVLNAGGTAVNRYLSSLVFVMRGFLFVVCRQLGVVSSSNQPSSMSGNINKQCIILSYEAV